MFLIFDGLINRASAGLFARLVKVSNDGQYVLLHFICVKQ